MIENEITLDLDDDMVLKISSTNCCILQKKIMIKCKLIKTSRYVGTDYDDFDRIMAESISDWEELTDDEYSAIFRWVKEHPHYMLVEPVSNDILRMSIKEQIQLENDRELEKKNKELARKQAENDRKKKQEKIKLERERKKFEELQKKFGELE